MMKINKTNGLEPFNTEAETVEADLSAAEPSYPWLPRGPMPWVNWVEKTRMQINQADRFGHRDVVPADIAMKLAAQVDQCREIRMRLLEDFSMLLRNAKSEIENLQTKLASNQTETWDCEGVKRRTLLKLDLAKAIAIAERELQCAGSTSTAKTVASYPQANDE